LVGLRQGGGYFLGVWGVDRVVLWCWSVGVDFVVLRALLVEPLVRGGVLVNVSWCRCGRCRMRVHVCVECTVYL